jgi:hypothetical protein
MGESTNNQNEIKRSLNVISWVELLLGLFLVISVFFPYGLGTYFFSKLLVFVCGLAAMIEVRGEYLGFNKNLKRLNLYGLYIFTLVWMFIAVGTENAGRIGGQSYDFTGAVFWPILFTLICLSVLSFFKKN